MPRLAAEQSMSRMKLQSGSLLSRSGPRWLTGLTLNRCPRSSGDDTTGSLGGSAGGRLTFTARRIVLRAALATGAVTSVESADLHLDPVEPPGDRRDRIVVRRGQLGERGAQAGRVVRRGRSAGASVRDEINCVSWTPASLSLSAAISASICAKRSGGPILVAPDRRAGARRHEVDLARDAADAVLQRRDGDRVALLRLGVGRVSQLPVIASSMRRDVGRAEHRAEADGKRDADRREDGRLRRLRAEVSEGIAVSC